MADAEHLDDIDRILVRELVADGRATLAHLATTAGLSVSGTDRLDDNQRYPTYGVNNYEANRNLLPAFFVSLGVVFRPDKLRH